MSGVSTGSDQTKFWIENPAALIGTALFPCKDMTANEKLNALSRLSILSGVALLFARVEWWSLALFGSLISIIVIKYALKTEGFSISPTYYSDDFVQTTVAPSFAEEWQTPSPYYDLVENAVDIEKVPEPMMARSYPYGQYMTTTNLLPSDEYQTHASCGGLTAAKEYANSSYLRHDLAFRENMTRIYRKKLGRRFANNTNDSFSPYNSW